MADLVSLEEKVFGGVVRVSGIWIAEGQLRPHSMGRDLGSTESLGRPMQLLIILDSISKSVEFSYSGFLTFSRLEGKASVLSSYRKHAERAKVMHFYDLSVKTEIIFGANKQIQGQR